MLGGQRWDVRIKRENVKSKFLNQEVETNLHTTIKYFFIHK